MRYNQEMLSFFFLFAVYRSDLIIRTANIFSLRQSTSLLARFEV
jgi:hypothetical protein